MKAAGLYGAHQPLVVAEVHLLPPQAGEVRVRCAASGVCHSDLHYIKGDRVCPMPVVLGHEGAGLVEEVGTGVTYVQPGTSVVVLACGGAERIMAVATMPSKLVYADGCGATHRVHASATEPVLAVRELPNGRGAAYACKAIGLTEPSVQAWQCTRRGGKAILVGVMRHGAHLPIDPDGFHQDRHLLGCTYGSAHRRAGMPQWVARYRANQLQLDELVSRTYHLADINTALAALEQGEVARSIIAYP